ncbi:cytochrome P450 [Streptomyces sp. NPDC015032]|uniref:cytochrome P450 family protein n=1 Tax=Streptomyces sp. NPDC015032 TaxID=3364937 RepID=UPI0036F7A51C
MSESAVDLMAPATLSDMVPEYASLREQGPLVQVAFPGYRNPIWIITGYEDVKAALRDPRFVVDQRNVPSLEGPGMVDQMIAVFGLAPEYRDYLLGMVFMDGKNHARLRNLVTPAFALRRISTLRPRLEHIMAELIAPLLDKPEADLIEDFTAPLAGAIICELIGVDEADRPQMLGWIRDQANEDPARRAAGVQGMVAYIKELIERRRVRPADDVITELIKARDADSDRLTETEMVAMVLLLINSGHHTTTHFIANSALTLLEHPDQLDRLRAEPELMPRAIHELLRVANVLPLSTPMYAAEDMEFRGVQIKEGDVVTGALLGANYDPEAFADPERFDLTREPGRAETHVAFGHGPHYCLGAALARLEGEIAIEQLFLRDKTLSLAVAREDLKFRPHPGGSLLVQLPVRF